MENPVGMPAVRVGAGRMHGFSAGRWDQASCADRGGPRSTSPKSRRLARACPLDRFRCLHIADKNSYAHARRPGDSTNSITAGSKSSPPGMALRATRERPLPGPPVRDSPNVPTRMAVAVASRRSLATSDARPDGCADDRHDTGARYCWVGCQEIAGVPDRDSRYHVGGRVRRNRNRDRIACHGGRRDEPSSGCPRFWWGQRLPCQRDALRLHRRWFPSGRAPSRRRCARNAPVTSGG